MKLFEKLKLAKSPLSSPIGLEIGTHELRAVQFDFANDRLRLRAARTLSADDDERRQRGFRTRLRRELQDAGFAGTRVVAAIPAHELKLMVVNYELEKEEHEPAAILDLVRQRLPEGLDESIVDYTTIRGAADDGERSALVALAREDVVVGHLEWMRRAGLEVEAIEIAPVAVRRLVTWPPGQYKGENAIVLHTDPTRSELIVLWGRRLILYREVAFSEAGVVKRLADVLELPHDAAAAMLRDYAAMEGPANGGGHTPSQGLIVRDILRPVLSELAHEVARALRYVESRLRGESVAQLLISGSLAGWTGIETLLAPALPIDVAVLNPLACLGGSMALDGQFGLEVAAGLALRGAQHVG